MKLRLKEIRNSQGLTIDQLVGLSGLSRGFISQLENGKRQPSAESLLSLSAALGCPIASLIEDEGLGVNLATLINDLMALSETDLSAVAQIVRSMLPKAP